MSKTRLLSCSCCGSEDIKRASCGYRFGVDNYIKCRTCGLKMQLCSELGWEELEKRWNTRKPIKRIVERLEGIKESIHLERDSIGEEIYKDRDTLQRARNLALQELAFEKAIEIVKEEGLN